jgi:hypothetical protein
MNIQEKVHPQRFLNKLEELINFTDQAQRTMDAEINVRLRSSTEMFILKAYGKESIFYRSYRKIDPWTSPYNLGQTKGLLLSIKDDIEFEMAAIKNESISISPDESNPTMNALSKKILEDFYINTFYNWEAIQNLIRFDPDFFEFSVEDAESIFQKFKEKGIIARTGIGEAFCITAEGRKLFERVESKKSEHLSKSEQKALLNASAGFVYDVFICHSSKDKLVIKKIIEDLKARNISYWYDEEQIGSGDISIDKMSEGLQKSKHILVCISKNFCKSNWARNEYQSVLTDTISGTTNQKIMPLVIDDNPDVEIPQLLKPPRRERYLYKNEYERLLEQLKK